VDWRLGIGLQEATAKQMQGKDQGNGPIVMYRFEMVKVMSSVMGNANRKTSLLSRRLKR